MSSDYLDYFKLKEDPFRLTPDIFYYYESPEHATALHSLEYCMREKEGFCLLTGEPGTGKTTLLRLLMDKWKTEAEIALIMTPRLSPDEFFQAVLEDFNINVATTNKNDLIKAFRDFLLDHAGSGRRVAIIVDEAQELPDSTLEELRLLSNLETDKEKLLQIILIGQPELRQKLLADPLRQLNQRITVRVELKSLTEPETSDYINTRLIKGGNSSLLFDEKAKVLIYNLSNGIPRTINLLASRSLMAASLDGSRVVFEKHVRTGASDVLENTRAQKPYGYRRMAAIAAGIILAGALVSLSFKFLPSADNSKNISVANQSSAVASTPSPPLKMAEKKVDDAFVAAVKSHVEVADPLKDVINAFNSIAKLWSINPVIQAEKTPWSISVTLERISARRGLRISEFKGQFDELIKAGYPAIIEIAPEGVSMATYAAVTSSADGILSVSPPLAGRDRVSRQDIERIWSGRALIPWKNHLNIPELIVRGSAQTEVRALQRLLNQVGVGVQESGVFDESTVEAVKKFQESVAIKPTGQLNAYTLMRIYGASREYFHPVL